MIIAATSTSITLSITGVDLIVLPITAELASTLSLSNKVLLETIINKYKKYKKHYEKDQQTITTFDRLYRKSLQKNVIDNNEYDRLCNFFTKYSDRTKNEIFLKI